MKENIILKRSFSLFCRYKPIRKIITRIPSALSMSQVEAIFKSILLSNQIR